MSTRFWITSGAPPYSPPTRQGTWNVASGEDVQYLGRKPQGSAGTSSINVGSTAANRTVLLHRSISDGAIAAGTLSGTVNWTIGVKESAAGLTGVWRIHIYVTTGSTDTPRGVLLNNYTGTAQFTTTATGASDGAQTVTPVNVQVGDRIVCEIGYQANASATTQNATINYGNVGGTDLAATDTAVTVEPGWFEFSGANGLWTKSFTTLTDAFPSTIDAKWTKSTNVTATGGRARIPTTTTLEDLYTATAYEIQGGQVAFQVPSLPATGGGSGAIFSAYLSAGPTISTTNLEFTYSPSSGNLMLRNNVGGADGSPTTLTYSAVSHQWWRFREAAGSIFMETSPDNVTWTTQRTISTITQWMRLGTLIFYAESSRTSGTGDFAEIDNVNPPVVHTITVNTASQVDTAQALGRTKTLTAGIASQVDTAQTLARAKTKTVPVAGQVDTAQALGRLKSRAVGTAGETDTAQPLGRTKAKALNPSGQVDTAQPIGRTKTKPLGTVTVIETAQPLGRLKTAVLAIAVQTDTAQALGRVKAKPIPTAGQADAAQTLARIKTRTLAPAAAVDTALAPGRVKARALTPATQIDTAQLLRAVKARTVGTVSEVDTALAVTPRTSRVLDVTLAVALAPPRWTASLDTPRWAATQRPPRWAADE